ncbi:TonB-dependent receptor plug domain-containing protein [Gloeocapsopsis crepidinum]|uniref:TonB-dependent receptor plug domain-containing protein n=1 Tax=Gloeocapsopsis crepidinum TaxID=693223 RepID=UPI001D154FFB|nr:TonB-dependent receptor plug domain-containing protein [Gloeocapsopsis crepidinum]
MNWRCVFGGKCCVRSLDIHFWLIVSTLGVINSDFVQLVQAFESEKKAVVTPASPTTTKIRRLSETEFPATSVKELLSQSPTPNTSLVQITEVEAVPTDKGVEVILQTPFGEQLQVTNRSSGNNYIADIPNAQLRLPSGDSFTFRLEKPVTKITEITVTNLDANTVRVLIIGETALPIVELFDSDRGLIIGAIAPVSSVQQPTDDETIEILVTGEQEGDRVPNASVGTRTDTPLRDIPQSIQIIPQQVLEDRQARSITEGLENTAGITSIVSPASGRDYFIIRGFENYGGFLVNGIPDPQISSDGSFVNAERLEVLRGPAAALYGEVGSLGGTINVVTRQPLSYPFYEVSATIGSYNDYQGIFDFSGPLDDSETVLYRLIGSYRNFGSFLDFDENSETFIAPSLALRFGPNTDFILEGDVNFLDQNGREAQPILGTVLENPNGEVSRSFNAAGSLNNELRINGRIGYRLEHRFNENLSLRNTFRYTFVDDNTNGGEPIIFSLKTTVHSTEAF